jgi:hypothetical protein
MIGCGALMAVILSGKGPTGRWSRYEFLVIIIVVVFLNMCCYICRWRMMRRSKTSGTWRARLIHPAQVELAEAQQIRVARSPTVHYAHPTQGKAQSPQKTIPMGEGWLSLLKWLPPPKLSEVG